MRTSGNFQKIYEAAKEYANSGDIEDRPMDPVVRHEDGVWMLESRMESFNGDIEVSLETFDSWFWETYKDATYTPDQTDIDEFVRTMSE